MSNNIIILLFENNVNKCLYNSAYLLKGGVTIYTELIDKVRSLRNENGERLRYKEIAEMTGYAQQTIRIFMSDKVKRKSHKVAKAIAEALKIEMKEVND